MSDRTTADEGIVALERVGQILAEMKKIKQNLTAENLPRLDALQTEHKALRTTKAYQDALLAD